MSIGPLINLAGGYIQSLFSNSSPSAAPTTGNTQSTNQLSPFAQILTSLQQLQQSSPSQYQTVTHQIAGNLQTAAQSATANGNTVLANRLTQLSTDFNNASTTSQLPSVQDLAQAIGAGGHYHRHHLAGSSVIAPSTSSIGNSSLSAQSIIDNTLSSAGL